VLSKEGGGLAHRQLSVLAQHKALRTMLGQAHDGSNDERASRLDARSLSLALFGRLYETVAQIAYATRGTSIQGPVLCPRTNQVFPDG
jgi:hypothetical protein